MRNVLREAALTVGMGVCLIGFMLSLFYATSMYVDYQLCRDAEPSSKYCSEVNGGSASR